MEVLDWYQMLCKLGWPKCKLKIAVSVSWTQCSVAVVQRFSLLLW